MKKTLISVAVLLSAGAMASAQAVKPSEVPIFKDWTVGCDNGLSCQAVALADEAFSEDMLSVVVTRQGGADTQINVAVSGASGKPGRYRVMIDGRLVADGSISTAEEPINISGATALKLLRTMARGKNIMLTDDSGQKIGSTSLAGAAAALRYIDAKQGRAGTKSAIVAIGKRTYLGRRASLPTIAATKIVPNNILPDTSAIVALSEASPCAQERFGSTQDTVYSLGNGPKGPRALVLLNCGAGAYNFSSGIYTGQRNASGKWSFEPAQFDYGATGFSDESEIPILVNAGWDAATQTMSSYSKARGLGDCGSSESYVWDGKMFRLTAASFMGDCRGSTDWIPTWRANVQFSN
ncbi:MAG: DUF1176 domain-containing protein [Sphingorhabdus sp.]